MGKLVPVVSYARHSILKDKGIEEQHRTNRKTARKFGWDVVHEFSDNDRSASKSEVVREEFEDMLRVLKLGQLPNGQPVHGVVLYHEDRLARRAGDYERFVDALTYDEGRVYADERGAKDLYSEDVEGMGLIGVTFSKIETRKMRRRMRRNHRIRAMEGKIAGKRPFGWNQDKLSVHPVEGPLLKRAVEQFVSGRSIASIIHEWNSADIRTSLGNEWTSTSLRTVIENPRLCGWRKLAGEIVTHDNGEPVTGVWEPLISPELWQAAQTILDARRGRDVHPDGSIGEAIPVDRRAHKYWLTGILRCGKPQSDGSLCMAQLTVMRPKNRKTHIYVCPAKSHGGCGGVGRSGDKVDQYIQEALLAKLETKESKPATPTDRSGADRIAELKRKQAELGAEWRAGNISNEFFFSEVGKIESEIARLKADEKAYLVDKEQAALSGGIRAKWFGSGDEKLDVSQKRSYTKRAVHAVIVHPAGKGKGAYGNFNPDLLEILWRS